MAFGLYQARCDICAAFVSDWLVRPMRNDEILYKDIHHKRLSNMIHEIIPIFNRFLDEISTIQIEMAQMIMQIDISLADKGPEEIHKVAWTSIGKWCRFVAEDEFNTVEVLLQENCVFKDKTPEFIDIWIGYCMCNLTSVKGIHREHLQGKEVLLKQIVSIPESFDELYN
jgi:hypothetical protein